MTLSNHAIERCNQRGIPEAMIDLVLRFGAAEYHRGSEIFRLDKKASLSWKSITDKLRSYQFFYDSLSRIARINSNERSGESVF